MLLADLTAHDGGQVELDGGLGNVELALTEDADDDGLVLGQSADVAGSQGTDQLLGAVVGVVLAGDEEHLVDVGNGTAVTTASVSVRTTASATSAGCSSDESPGDASDDESSDDGGLDGDDAGQDEGGVGHHDDGGEDDKDDGEFRGMHFRGFRLGLRRDVNTCSCEENLKILVSKSLNEFIQRLQKIS